MQKQRVKDMKILCCVARKSLYFFSLAFEKRVPLQQLQKKVTSEM